MLGLVFELVTSILHTFFLAEAYQHERLRQEAVRKCGGFNDLEGSCQHAQSSFFSFETLVNRAL